MSESTHASTRSWPLSRRATIAVVVIYLLSAAAIWWKYPASPRRVVRAGPLAQFAGFSPDGQWMITSDQPAEHAQPAGGQLFTRFWNVHTGSRGIVLGALPGAPLGFTPDGKRFFVDATYYDVATGKPLPDKHYVNRTLQLPPVVSPDEKVVAETGFREINVLDADTRKSRFTVKPANVAAFHPGGRELAVAIDLVEGEPIPVGPLRYQLKFFDPQSGAEQRALPETAGRVRFMSYSAAGDKLAVIIWTGGEKGVFQAAIQIWNLESGQIEHSLPLESEVVSGLQSMQFITDGRVVHAQGMFRTLLWDSSAPVPDQLIGQGKLGIFAPILSADGRLTAYWDNQAHELIIRRLGDGKSEVVNRLRYSDPRITLMPLALTPDRQLIAMVSTPQPADALAKIVDWFRVRPPAYEVFDIATGQSLGGVPHFPRTTVAGVTPDGRTLVTRDFDYKLCDKFTIWDMPTGKPWFVIFGGALIPAGLVGWVLRWRQTRRPIPATSSSPT